MTNPMTASNNPLREAIAKIIRSKTCISRVADDIEPCVSNALEIADAILSLPPQPDARDGVIEDEVELLERVREYLDSIPNKGNCGPHHLVSDLASLILNQRAAIRSLKSGASKL